jgi:hypothetical protein
MANKQKGARKMGRCKRNGQSARYKAEFRCQKNQLRRVLKHLERFPADICADKCRIALENMVGPYQRKWHMP